MTNEEFRALAELSGGGWNTASVERALRQVDERAHRRGQEELLEFLRTEASRMPWNSSLREAAAFLTNRLAELKAGK